MQVTSTQLQMVAQRSAVHVRSERLDVDEWGPGTRAAQSARTQEPAPRPKVDPPQIAAPDCPPPVAADGDDDGAWGAGLDVRSRLSLMVLRRLLGADVSLLGFDPGSADDIDLPGEAQETTDPSGGVTPAEQQWGMHLHYEREELEAEHVRFTAQGRVKLGDGREIEFAVDLEMDRVAYERSSLDVQAGAQRKDPLIISLSGGAVQLDPSRRVALDLDGDGRAEKLAALQGDAGMLVADRDGDGKVSGGKEVLGARSGDAYADLRELDDDGNGWIDAGDRAYAYLALWRPGEDGVRTLVQAGVGAISVHALDTRMKVGGVSDAYAEVRETGLVLTEDGRVTVAQRLDFLA